MGTTDTRFPKNYRIKSGVIRTPLYPNESISSWLIRAALDCGTEPIVFTGFYWEKWRLWTFDLDRGFELIAPHIYEDIAELSLNRQVDLTPHSLSSILQPINGEKTLIKGQAKWVISRSSRNRTYRNGQPYCACCLGQSPYLRNEWRLAWNFGCLEHQTLLETKCPDCGEPYQPHLLSADKRQLNHCHCCGETLTVSESKLTQLEIDVLALLDDVLKTNSGYCFQQPVNAQTYFAILRYFINLIRRAAVMKLSHALARFIEQLGIPQAELCQTKTALAFELLPAEERKNFVVNAVKILQISRESFIQAIKQSGITQSVFAFEVYPSELETLFKYALKGKTVTRKTVKSKPKTDSILTLNRQWERLKRQLQIAG
ncbi:hypothetical protein BKG95_08325 [Rodentibacter pneumotropicus]|uniref:TniQ family protein n=1 Tax=Rodentibacter pneumotropicus TaxID=758 RepID=A0AAW5L9E1_9PAST|nr:TniQ family protein [Rodentibacter pneumotropicus]MCQ9120233.1 TniQ family protein [Rodentibacter pneumotropicus]OOF67051.1 hypothetical protein BKG95_08325 [Rodentibacter pneumotropicus]